MPEEPDASPLLRCRNCGHKMSLEAAQPADAPDAGRCPNCGERSLILTTARPEKNIKLT